MASNDDVPELEETCKIDSDSDHSDSWDEIEENPEQTKCLFCNLQFRTIAVAMEHCKTKHNFDLLLLKNKHSMDCYSYIKLINYIRINKASPDVILKSDSVLWEDEKYLKPSEDVATWLMFDFDDFGSCPSTPNDAITNKNALPFNDLNKDLILQMQSMSDDILKMKEVVKKIMTAGDGEICPANVGSRPVAYDDAYFESYEHFGIHHEMLSDKVRTESYMNAILKNVESFKNKKVLDVGCGTGILSMFAAKAEAEKVVGIDMSEIIYKAMDIIRENNLEDKIELIKGRLEDTELPIKKFDIIISEWMGYFLFFEGMLDSVIYARDHHLLPGGLILPNKCTVSLTAISDPKKHSELISFWKDVYGFKMTCMTSEVLCEAHIETIAGENVISDAFVLTEIDINSCSNDVCDFTSNFKLSINKDGCITALAGYFDTFFELDHPVYFSTGPLSTRTHWQQTVFYLKTPICVKKGDVIEGTMTCARATRNVRGLNVILKIGDVQYQYKIH